MILHQSMLRRNFAFSRDLGYQETFQAIRKLSSVSENFPGYPKISSLSRNNQPIWKLSRLSGNFPDHPEKSMLLWCMVDNGCYDAWLRLWTWNVIKTCARVCYVTERSYLGKQNSTLDSIVPLTSSPKGPHHPASYFSTRTQLLLCTFQFPSIYLESRLQI